MARHVFKSCFAEELNKYLDLRMAAGYREKSFSCMLSRFDRFCLERGIAGMRFTSEDAAFWLRHMGNEGERSRYSRIQVSRHFLIYLAQKGHDVHVMRPLSSRNSDFCPHIYSADEIRRYFHVVDTYFDSFSSYPNRKGPIQLPILFRLLYCCGTRINETLGIRKCDVNLQNGTITLHETKNSRERIIVLSHGMFELMNEYADKCFYLLGEKSYIFSTRRNTRYDHANIQLYHRNILERADIPFLGEGKGPRIHDWRHTFAVHSFKQMLDNGRDMYVALPILSAYLGHQSIQATEKYVRLTCEMYPYIQEKFRPQLDSIFGEVAPE